jgi:hypothetical protein
MAVYVGEQFYAVFGAIKKHPCQVPNYLLLIRFFLLFGYEKAPPI